MEIFDVVVVGAGAAGALAAYELGRNCARVLVLEAGPENKPRDHMMARYLAATPRQNHSPFSDHIQAPRPTGTNPDDYYVQHGPDIFNAPYERRVGGTTWAWLGTTPRFLPSDFRTQTHYGVGTDWPITYDDLEPWYAEAEKELHVAGCPGDDLGSPRSSGYPKQALAQSYSDQLISRALAGSEFEGNAVRVSPTPQARDPEKCLGSGSCIPLCPQGAIYEADQHVRKGKAQGVLFRDQAIVHQLNVGENHQIESLSFLNWAGESTTVKARYFVLAANAIETPRLLLMSASKRAPEGVANGSDQVGRHLMDHPIQMSWALTKDPIYPFRGPMTTSGIESLRDGPFRSSRGAFRTEFGNEGWQWIRRGPDRLVRTLAAQKMYGKALKEALSFQAQRQLRITSLLEQLPDAANRITLDEKACDAMGLPRPAVHYHVDEYTQQGLASAKACHQFIFDKLGVLESHHLDAWFSASHIMGTCRMGHNPNTSVVDEHLRSHDHANLYILGSAVFPTSGTANPTLTIAALSLRAANHMLKNLGSNPGTYQ